MRVTHADSALGLHWRVMRGLRDPSGCVIAKPHRDADSAQWRDFAALLWAAHTAERLGDPGIVQRAADEYLGRYPESEIREVVLAGDDDWLAYG